jgi:hypothetical protein
MQCDRCGGLQLRSHFQSGRGMTTASWEYDGWLCLNCGEIVDPLILVNRIVQNQLHDHISPRPYDGSKVTWIRRSDDLVA